jgi:UDP-N-acetylglucosamine 2-epimerase (non-hydrolysing)
VVFPAHPRTRAALKRLGLDRPARGFRLIEPLPYVPFLALVASAAGVLTDSGGIQEETTYLGVPCLTLRGATERPVTVTLGTNVLLGLEPERIRETPGLLREVAERPRTIPDGWDGHAAERIVEVVARHLDAALPQPREAAAPLGV